MLLEARQALSSLSWAPTPTFIKRSQRLPPAELHPAGGQGEAGSDGEAAGGQAAGQVPRGEELVVQQLIDGGPGSRVGPQHLLDEVCGHRVDVLRNRGSLEMGQGTMCSRDKLTGFTVQGSSACS